MENSISSANTMSRPAISRCSGWAWSRYKGIRQSGDVIVDGQTETDIGQAIVDKGKRVLPGGTFGNFAAEVAIPDGKAGRVWDGNGKESSITCPVPDRCRPPMPI